MVIDFVSWIKDGDMVSDEIFSTRRRLWLDSRVQKCLKYSNENQLNNLSKKVTGGSHSTRMIHHVSDFNYSQGNTTGIAEVHFSVNDLNFKIFDVSGQRSERKKWIHYFADVTAIIFCVPMSEYDQALQEDIKTNRLQDSLKLFDSICNNKWLNDTPIILFLNNVDEFKLKIKKSPLTICFPKYTGKQEFEEAFAYIKDKFKAMNKSKTREILCYMTSAKDIANIDFVYHVVSELLTCECGSHITKLKQKYRNFN
ncbi:guanine nucleotide-binding protein G(o) subunit alpha 1-like protein [Leptotrombidium deliense]|uniref:Guanine nucleotide-binding protein G(O) subunit alpha 1-like protein n=1 Tax=Leptotrombidium deliense TaxID=299467 RepID=A0A443SEK9_9ACAR|nr:guanine nucleotide-binding protein G(o) subunit alpha 1-like protein [Leptotrombidium deliense]